MFDFSYASTRPAREDEAREDGLQAGGRLALVVGVPQPGGPGHLDDIEPGQPAQAADQVDQPVEFCGRLLEAAAAETPDYRPREAVVMWLAAGRICYQERELDRAIHCGQQALKCDADSYQAHFTTAQFLLAAGQFSRAEEEFRWCLLRQPLNKKLRTLVETAVRSRLAEQESGIRS